MMRETRIFHILAYALIVTTVVVAEDSLSDGLPEKKLISTFQIVRFPNEACLGSNSRNGTCYTSAECSDKGGASAGSCADGFGVCCTFLISACGSTSSENITYWKQPTTVTKGASCHLKLCPTNNNICQLRIDFLNFVITGPSMSSQSENMMQYGVVPTVGTAILNAITWKTNCLTDSFSVSGKSISNSPPTLCGTNSAYHMYVDANVEDCNILEFNIGLGVSTTLTNSATRGVTTTVTPTWDMTIYQYECGAINSAPPGCTQYFWGPNTITGKIVSYNYVGNTAHLANQNQKICIRRERNYCWACFATDATAAIDFQVGGCNGLTESYTYPGQPCGYTSQAGNGNGGDSNVAPSYDCVIIPDAFVVGAAVSGIVINTGTTALTIRTNTDDTARMGAPPQITGYQIFGYGRDGNNALQDIPVTGGNQPTSFCTNHIPFQLTFKSDEFEGTGMDSEGGDLVANTAYGQRGFNMNYELIKCTA